jgi:hypothetical protein
MIAPDDLPTLSLLFGLNKLQAIQRARPSIHNIASHNHGIWTPLFKMRGHSFQGSKIPVNIG